MVGRYLTVMRAHLLSSLEVSQQLLIKWYGRRTNHFGCIGNFTKTTGSMNGLASKTLSATTIASAISVASGAIGQVDAAMTAVSKQRASFGAVQNRLTHAVDNLTNVVTNAEVTRSRILDTDYAAATSELARTQIIQQAGTAMLAQANQLLSIVLGLLQN